MKAVYSALKPFRFADRVQALIEGRPAPPVHIRVKPVNACNHKCWYCAYRADDLDLGSGMNLRDRIPKPKMDELVEDFIAMGVRAVTFSGGGEPLLYQDMPGVVRRLAEGGVKVATLTNGAFLRDATADAFAAHGTWVRVSMDGWDGPSYAKSRSIPEEEYGKVMGNLRAFAAKGSRCALGVSFIVSKDNCEHLEDFCRQARDAGVGHVKLSACVVANTGAENNRYHETIAAVVGEQIEKARGLEREGFSVVDHYHQAPERFDKPYHSCPFARFLTVVGADLNVYACQDKAYTDSGRLGSIRDMSFREFWLSEENQRRLAAIDPSRDCLHHCVAHSKNLLLTDLLSLDAEHTDFV